MSAQFRKPQLISSQATCAWPSASPGDPLQDSCKVEPVRTDWVSLFVLAGGLA